MDIVSNSPLIATSRVYRTARGVWCRLVICKATYSLSPTTASLASTQEAILDHDLRWEDKPERSVFAPSDVVPFKRDVDVVLVGHAFSAAGQPVRSIMTRLCVGEIDKRIEVFGDRLYTAHGELRDGAKINRARLRYERAFGGPGTTNPVGMRHDKKDLFGSVSLANLQPPGLHVTHPDDLSETVGYGPIAPEWPLRAGRLGQLAPMFLASAWYENVLPEEIDPSFFNVAPHDQRLREVRPDERILLEGLTVDQPRFVTQLPGLMPNVVVERGTGRRDPLPLRADTLWIDTSRRLCTLTWRGTLALAHPSEAGRIVVTLSAPEVSRVYQRHDPALLAMPMNMSDPDGGDTLSINVGGESRPATPFDSRKVAEPQTMDLNLDDPALAEDDAITFVQTDSVQSNTLPFVNSHQTGTERTTHMVPTAVRDNALPFAAPGRAPAPSSPALPFVSPTVRPSTTSASDGAISPGAAPPVRDLPFVSPIGPSTKSGSGSFSQHATPPMFPASPPVATPPTPPPPVFPVHTPHMAPVSPPAAVFPGSTPRTTAASFAVVGAPTSFPASPTPVTPPPPLASDIVPEAPPMIGPLATPEMAARAAIVPDSPAPPPAGKPRDNAKEAQAVQAEDDTIERCAQISASIARRKEDRTKILDAEKLDDARFKSMQVRWNEAIQAETSKGKTKLLEKFDDAYVSRLEEERGPIRPEEFARVVVAAERGVAETTLLELGLPPNSLMRIERVFLRRTMGNAELSQRVTRSIETERDS